MRRKPVLVSIVTCGLLMCHGNVPGLAKDPTGSSGRAQPARESLSLAEQVLKAELKGDLEERSRLVLDLREGGTADALALSIGGKVRDREGWKSVEEIVEKNRQLPAIDRYERFRSGQPDTLQGHINVAQWCRRAGLDAQQSAHWHRVLQIDPNHQLARTELGHRLIDGAWVSPEDLARLRQQVSSLQISLKKHGRDLMRLRAEMMDDREARREAAAEKFLAIDAADAIPAIAAIFAGTPTPVIDRAVQWMSGMPDPAAAEVLARWSVDHPTEHVRDLCIEALKRRSFHEYVPLLLDRTRSRLVSAIVPSIRPDGSLAGTRHIFSREAKDEFDIAVVDSVSVRQPIISAPVRARRGIGDLDAAVERAQRDRQMRLMNSLTDMQVREEATRAAVISERIAAAENRVTDVVNDRVRLVLSRTSGTDPQATPQDLWDWWSRYTEREPSPIKLTSYRYRMNLSSSNFYTNPPPSCECFVAGTPVMTSRGEKPIESLIVGDQVLSKNIGTGELVWDVVLRTTNQEAKPLVMVKTDNDQLRCTGGHLFWVSGKGWTKARDLKDGDLLHGLSRPSVVISVTESDAEITYNLITGRYHNYFVGEGKSLSHDFDEQAPTAIRVPGLAYTVGR